MSREPNDSVDAERQKLERALQQRTAQLAAINQEFEQFTYSLSHDLRAPLRALEGFAKILLEDYGEKLDAEGKRCLAILETSSQKASMLIEDLLVVSRTCRGPVRYAKVDMNTLLNRTLEQMGSEPAQAKIQIEPLPEAWGDREFLGHIWAQLLSNALKFSSKQKQPVIEISGRTEERQTVYSIRDNGVGFDNKFAERLFVVFHRLHTEQEFEGRGIGLTIVHRLVHRHGGKVSAAGELNKGATFTFSIPLKEEAPPS